MIDFEKFYQDGYVSFSIEEFFENEEDKKIFEEAANRICEIPPTDDHWHYTMSVEGTYGDPTWPMLVTGDKREDQLKRAEQEGLRVTQRWHTLPNYQSYTKEINKLISKNIRRFYPEINEDMSNLIFSDSVTLYKNGDHIECHRDGNNVGRICAILVYLSLKDDYKDGGGHLTISGNIQGEENNVISVEPVRGNVAIMDFNRHDPFHTVEEVKNGFLRYAYLAFLWDYSNLPLEQKLKWTHKRFSVNS